MNGIDPAQVDRAIARLSRQSSAAIEQVLLNSRRLENSALAQACEEELRARGSLKLGAADAEQAARNSERAAGKSLSEVIRMAFEEVPAKSEEIPILEWIARHPGTSCAELGVAYGKNDLTLVIGHLVYHRFGYFRPLLNSKIQSDLLLERDSSSGRVCYRLRPEALEAFTSLGVLDG